MATNRAPIIPDPPPHPVQDGPILKVLPENFWHRVWHDAPCRGIMKMLPESLTDPKEGFSIPAWECLMCGTKMYAGLDAQNRVITRPF